VADATVLEHLRYIGAAVDGLREDAQDLKRRMTSLEMQVAQLHGDFAGRSARIDRVESRLERIERRLELTPAR
jgi:predicted  nucleic acid-binding Zn-ribbon protein